MVYPSILKEIIGSTRGANLFDKEYEDFYPEMHVVHMEIWQEDCAAYNDPGSVNPFVVF